MQHRQRKTPNFHAGSRDTGPSFKSACQRHANLTPGSAVERWNDWAVGVGFQLPSWVRGELRRRVNARVSGMALAVASLLASAPAQAQSFTWGGATTDYNLGTNWAPTAGAPPVAAGQSTIFGTTGNSAVVVTAGLLRPIPGPSPRTRNPTRSSVPTLISALREPPAASSTTPTPVKRFRSPTTSENRPLASSSSSLGPAP